MRLRLVWLVVFLLLPASARASDHTASLFGALSFASGSTLSGLHGSVEVSWPTSHPLHDYFAIIIDGSAYGGEHDSDSVTRATFLVGGRGLYRFPRTNQVVSGEVLLGVVRSHTSAGKDNNFGLAIGGGYEYLLGDADPQTSPQGWGVRFQSDYVFQNSGDGFARASAGVIYRFK